MDVTIWGCRGSIASPGQDTVKYGGESTCLELTTNDGDVIIIDAGSGMRKLGNKILAEKKVHTLTLLLTHAHWDHLSGFPFFKPAYSPNFTIHICGGGDAQNSVLKYLQHQMSPPYFPVDFTMMKATFTNCCTCETKKCTNSLINTSSTIKCESIPLSHPNGGYGFKFTENSRSFVFLTDNELRFIHEKGLSRDKYVAFCQNADLLFHDAQYLDSEYHKFSAWGHSTYTDAIDLAIDAGVKRLGLWHHDPERTDSQIDTQMALCHNYIATRGSLLECFACREGMELHV